MIMPIDIIGICAVASLFLEVIKFVYQVKTGK